MLIFTVNIHISYKKTTFWTELAVLNINIGVFGGFKAYFFSVQAIMRNS